MAKKKIWITGDELKIWQSRMGFTYVTAAEALGINRSSYGRHVQLGAGKTIALACAALYNDILPYGSAK